MRHTVVTGCKMTSVADIFSQIIKRSTITHGQVTRCTWSCPECAALCMRCNLNILTSLALYTTRKITDLPLSCGQIWNVINETIIRFSFRSLSWHKKEITSNKRQFFLLFCFRGTFRRSLRQYFCMHEPEERFACWVSQSSPITGNNAIRTRQSRTQSAVHQPAHGRWMSTSANTTVRVCIEWHSSP